MAHGFDKFFHEATDAPPFPFQRELATTKAFPALVNIPTGLGKTAMAVVGWLWRRFGAGEEVRRQTPRRLVYCLPMRVLVEQTRDNAIRWLKKLRECRRVQPEVLVHVLMGGEDEDDWDIHPEREAIIIGTQDMLLSRALNRGYTASRSRWPIQFGLLHTDCLWVFDEIQLMGSGLATSAQLEAFRRQLAGADGPKDSGCKSVWMSATLRPDWLRTVDFKDRIDEQGRIDGKETLSLTDADHANEQVGKRWNAKKPLTRAECAMDDPGALAAEVRQAHRPGTRTIVVVNTVKRARVLFESLRNTATAAGSAAGRRAGRSRREAPPPAPDAGKPTPALVLLHSRFRPPDRAKRVAEALAKVDPSGPGTIVVSTQVIEAGVDVSAATLFTELAPWASLVQRFGRCNRSGQENEHASVRWIDIPTRDTDAEKLRHPYELADLRAASQELEKLKDVALRSMDAHRRTLTAERQEALFPYQHTHVIRRRDLIDLFDTTPDLAGNDIDIDRFVREVEDSDVRVFWRAWDRPKGHESPSADEPAPRREELCPAPIGVVKRDSKGKKTYTDFRKFVSEHSGSIWRWSFLEEKWEPARADEITPGQVFLIHAATGGYSMERGWTGNPGDKPTLEYAPKTGQTCSPEGNESDANSRIGVWQMLTQHTDEVSRELKRILEALEPSEVEALRLAARWHDLGKTHEIFRTALPDGIPDATKHWAKAAGQWKRYERRHFRHELASALAVLQRPHGTLKTLRDDDLNLVAYLVAAHHGKVRLSIRSLPNEHRPRDGDGTPAPQKRFARGVWDGDELPATDLGGGVRTPAVTLSLEPMELGLCEQPPFAGQPSWSERMTRLRDSLGPFRLAYLEAILRAADMRASAKAAEQGAATDEPVGSGADANEAVHG